LTKMLYGKEHMKLRRRLSKMENELNVIGAMDQLEDGIISYEKFIEMGFRLKRKLTMFDWVRFPPNGELKEVEKNLMQGVLEDASKVSNLERSSLLKDLKKKYFHGPVVPNDSDILEDLDVDAFLKDKVIEEEFQETKRGGVRRITRSKRRIKVRKKGTKKNGYRKRKYSSVRKVRKKGTKKSELIKRKRRKK